MFQKAFSIAGTLLIAGAVVLMVPEFSQARGGGGGHGGGGHGGGHFAGGHFGGGGWHGGYGGWHGGYHGGWYGGHRGGWYGRGYGYGRYGGYGYYPYYGYGGYYPYSYYPYYDNYSYPGYSSYPSYSSGYYDPSADVVPDSGYSSPAPAAATQALYSSSSAAVQPDTPAHMTVKVPADAKVTLNGTPTTSTGTLRQFISPPLAAGKYTYDVEARWNDNGKEVTQTRHIAVAPGAHVEVAFPTQRQADTK